MNPKNTIELIPPSHTPGTKTPDVIINGVAWEIKCPGGNNYKTIERALHRGVRQSQNIILDLRFMKIPDQKLHQIVIRLFAHSRSIRKLKIIFRSQKVVDFRK